MRAAALALAGALVSGPVPAAHALTSVTSVRAAVAAVPARSDVGPAALSGVPAAGLLAHGRVLVLRPGTLEVALDGGVRRLVAVPQPLDLADLPALLGDPAYAARTAPGDVRLGAVLVQRPGTAVTMTGGRLDLADTAGAGPGRLTGTRAGLDLEGVTVTASSALGAAATPGARIVTAGLRYLHESDVRLQDVVLRGLGTPGPAGLAAVRVGSGSRVHLARLTLDDGGRGVQLDEPGEADVDGLHADHATGDVLGVVGGTGARISGLRTLATAGAALRLRATASTTLTDLASTGDAHALVATDVDGLQAVRLTASGSGLVVGGRGVQLEEPRIDAPAAALRLDAVTGLSVHGGSLRGAQAVRADARSHGVRLEGVTTAGLVVGPVTVVGGTTDDAARPGRRPAEAWWAVRLRGAGSVGLVVIAGGLVLEVLRGRRRRGRREAGAGRGRVELPAPSRAVADGAGELVLDLGERRV